MNNEAAQEVQETQEVREERETRRTKRAKRLTSAGFWWRTCAILALVTAVTYCMVYFLPVVRDWWLGWSYRPSDTVADLRESLGLTAQGERIFNATRPTLESSETFNELCNSQDADVMLLGCYTEGKIYVYEITEPQLVAANKVTLAHELLHAAWERMYSWERDQVKNWLQTVYNEREEWFNEELEAYDDGDKTEEVYTRAGTKLADLPEELEKHYAKYFRDRAQIVAYYQEYEAPFLELKQKGEDLLADVTLAKSKIENERAEYTERVAQLDQEIEQFNRCAAEAGCFTDKAEFDQRRSEVIAERANLEAVRMALNQKITDNNAKIEEYRQIQQMLGELNDAMNSHIELMETTQSI